jgi:hypothetical protein
MWPFTKKEKAEPKDIWGPKIEEVCKRIAKLRARVGPQVAKTVLAGNTTPPPGAEENVQMEVVVFCVHVCDRLMRERFKTSLPPSLTNMLLDRTGKFFKEDARNQQEADKLKADLANMHADRIVVYQGYTQLRAERGQSDHGTLVDGFAKLLTNIYSKNNALARTMLLAQGLEIVKTIPHYLDEAGMAA